MKKTALFLSCLLALTACSDNNEAQNNTPASTQAASAPVGVAEKQQNFTERYIVGTDANFPPFDFQNESGQIVGFDIDILRAIGEKEGFGVDFVSALKRSDLFPNLADGQYQILAACLGMSAERLAQSEMSKPYAYAPNVIMGKESGTAMTLAELGNAKVAVQEGSYTFDELKKAQVSNIVPEKSMYNAYITFAKGNADYVVGDAGVLSYHHIENKDPNKPKVYTSVYDKDADVRVAFAVKKGNTELINKINSGLKKIKEDGTYEKIYTKWFGEDNSLRVPETK